MTMTDQLDTEELADALVLLAHVEAKHWYYCKVVTCASRARHLLHTCAEHKLQETRIAREPENRGTLHSEFLEILDHEFCYECSAVTDSSELNKCLANLDRICADCLGDHLHDCDDCRVAFKSGSQTFTVNGSV